MSQASLKGRQWQSLIPSLNWRIFWWSHIHTLILFLGANYCHQFVHARYGFTDQSEVVLVSLASISAIKQIKTCMFIIWPQLQVQIFHNPHPLPFALCSPKGTKRTCISSMINTSPCTLQGRGFFSGKVCARKPLGFQLICLQLWLIWQSHGWLSSKHPAKPQGRAKGTSVYADLGKLVTL